VSVCNFDSNRGLTAQGPTIVGCLDCDMHAYAHGVFVDRDGVLYVSDSEAHRIRVVT
jgi:NHL repeat